jgi:multiple antibiotic resistance protein
MKGSLSDLLSEFIMMWVLIDPIGTLPIFLALTARVAAERRAAVAVRAIVIAGVVLIFFIVAGRILLHLLDIPLMSFQIAGGIVLFLFALTMIFGESKADSEKDEIATAERERSMAVYPLAIPSIAGPGAMLGAVLLTDSPGIDLLDQLTSIVTTVIVLAIALVILLAASPIHRLIGDSGTNVLSRVMGLLLAAVAVNNVIEAAVSYFNLPAIPS